MAHDARCGTATTPTGDCDCECDGRLHGIGDESDDTDHRSQVITEEEQRLDEEFRKHFKPYDEERIISGAGADVRAWDQLKEENPELAQLLQEAEDNPDIDFEVGDVYWEKGMRDRERRVVDVPLGPEFEDLPEEKREKTEDAFYQYAYLQKAHYYQLKAEMLRELNEVTTEKEAFPETRHIQSSIEKVDDDPEETLPRRYVGRHRFGDLVVKRTYRESEDGEEMRVDTRFINSGNYDFSQKAQDVVEETTWEHDMDDIDDVKEFVKDNHNVDPQGDFRKFGD